MVKHNKRKPIPGSWFLVVGAAMVLMSVFIDVEKLIIFILAGAVFVVIGFFKIIMDLEEGKKKTKHHTKHKTSHHHKVHHSENKSHPTHKTTHHTKKTEHGKEKIKHTESIRCTNCGVKLHPSFKYCPNCGQRLN